MNLTVKCVDGLAMLKWNTQDDPEYFFVVDYGCNSTASCSGGEKVAGYNHNDIAM